MRNQEIQTPKYKNKNTEYKNKRNSVVRLEKVSVSIVIVIQIYSLSQTLTEFLISSAIVIYVVGTVPKTRELLFNKIYMCNLTDYQIKYLQTYE